MSLDKAGVNRRIALGRIAALAVAGTAPMLAANETAKTAPGRLRQSLCRWTSKAPLPELCRSLKDMGFAGIDLIYPDEWSIVNDSGLAVSMGYASRREKFIQTGFNDPANHAMLLNELETAIPRAKQAGVKNLIAMFGNRNPAIDEGRAAENCIAGLSKIAPLAADNGITICVELLNSKVDHRGYQGDHTAFGVAVMKGIGSPNVKLLYDIYHMQIMEGDVIRTIRDNIAWIGHFHTGGVPGRHEINGTQELNYRAIAAAIADLNYTGYIAHEFSPTRSDASVSQAEAFAICSV
ncbi:MAG: TIM barrel protein [Proteobacteria bacterium]|uniref:hydroxypyruvate isomerase family protein n=1 Tax=Rudaea sp. TaxID=2136325 RepID=UPI001D8AD456|nr:TIM barrel protein [Pseudomonadota bacterium]MBS0567302.1 TIM barrel protein [Pseudomonadota bacterium]